MPKMESDFYNFIQMKNKLTEADKIITEGPYEKKKYTTDCSKQFYFIYFIKR